MCLNCEYYLDSCDKKECIAAADRDDIFRGKILTLSLWRGYGEPCVHIKEANPDWEALSFKD